MKTLLHILLGTKRGGCERDCFMVCHGLASVAHHVLVVSGPGPMSDEFVAIGAKVTHLDLDTRSWFRLIGPIRNYAAKNAIDAVIIWHGMVALPQILFALRNFDVPICVHGGNPAHSLLKSVDLKFLLLTLLLPTPRLPTYACCSEFVAHSFDHSWYLRRFPRVVILNGVLSIGEADSHHPREIPVGESFTIGMLARLDAIKDHATLLRAFVLVVRERPLARLELAGDGDLRRSLENLARTLGIFQNVTFLGMVSDVYLVMQTWDVFAYSTTKEEGMGNALAEGMMLGLPCIATDVGPIREVAGTPSVIELLPPGDVSALAQMIISLIDDVARRRTLGRRAKERAQSEFSAATFARHYSELLWPETGN